MRALFEVIAAGWLACTALLAAAGLFLNSGAAFVDNAALREYAFRTFQPNVLNMETAAMAHVAHANVLAFLAAWK